VEDIRTGTNAYAEWYGNSVRVPGSPTARWHHEHYGDAPYESFADDLSKTLQDWDPAPWADLFAAAGARYVVFTTKHHDGYALWPTAHDNPHRPGWHTERDVVGDVADAVRSKDMRFGCYYSGGYDWTFEAGPVDSVVDLVATLPVGRDYAEYVDAHYRELVARYRPSILWNDIGMPTREGLAELLADYVEAVPDGTYNDRFIAWPRRLVRAARVPAVNAVLDAIAGRLHGKGTGVKAKRPRRGDYATPEYRTFDEPVRFPWETCRGLGKSFGYNRAEGESHHLSVEELVRSFLDVVAKGGNLLLNVGPDGDGVIPELQASRLRALGAWLAVNGEGVYGTRPWVRAGAGDLRFTQKDGRLYAFVLTIPATGSTVRIPDVPDLVHVELLGHGPVGCRRAGTGLEITWPEIADFPAYVLRLG
jgi:alpha-L-fucosidase